MCCASLLSLFGLGKRSRSIREALTEEFKSTNPWRKPNIIPRKDDYAAAMLEWNYFVVAKRIGTHPWKTEGYESEIKPIMVLPLRSVPEGLWESRKPKDIEGWIRHPETRKWLNVSNLL